MEFIAFDLETTGLDPRMHRIVEIGAVRFSGGELVDSYGALIDPGCPIPAEASRVSGITDRMVAGCEREEAVLGLLTAFCGDLPLVAHNAPFDVKFLGAAFERHRIPAPAGAVYDTCALARGMFPSLSDYRLGTLADFFELRPERLHRAVEDAATCGLLILRLVETLRRNGEPGDWPALQTRLGRKELRLPMIAPPPPQLDLF